MAASGAKRTYAETARSEKCQKPHISKCGDRYLPCMPINDVLDWGAPRNRIPRQSSATSRTMI
jgi:hypothetical protein